MEDKWNLLKRFYFALHCLIFHTFPYLLRHVCFLCLITLNTHYSKYIDLHLTLELEGRGVFWRTVLFMVLARCSSLCLKETHGHHFVKKKKKKIKVSQAPVSRGSEFVNSGLRFF